MKGLFPNLGSRWKEAVWEPLELEIRPTNCGQICNPFLCLPCPVSTEFGSDRKLYWTRHIAFTTKRAKQVRCRCSGTKDYECLRFQCAYILIALIKILPDLTFVLAIHASGINFLGRAKQEKLVLARGGTWVARTMPNTLFFFSYLVHHPAKVANMEQI